MSKSNKTSKIIKNSDKNNLTPTTSSSSNVRTPISNSNAPVMNLNLILDPYSFAQHGYSLIKNQVIAENGRIICDDHQKNLDAYFTSFGKQLKGNNVLSIEQEKSKKQKLSFDETENKENNAIVVDSDNENDNNIINDVNNTIPTNTELREIIYILKDEDYADLVKQQRMWDILFDDDEYHRKFEIEDKAAILYPWDRRTVKEIIKSSKGCREFIEIIMDVKDIKKQDFPNVDYKELAIEEIFKLSLLCGENDIQEYKEGENKQKFWEDFKIYFARIMYNAVVFIKRINRNQTIFNLDQVTLILGNVVRFLVEIIDMYKIDHYTFHLRRVYSVCFDLYNTLQKNEDLETWTFANIQERLNNIKHMGLYYKYYVQNCHKQTKEEIQNEYVTFLKTIDFTQLDIKQILNIKEKQYQQVPTNFARKQTDSKKSGKEALNEYNKKLLQKNNNNNHNVTDLDNVQDKEHENFQNRLNTVKEAISNIAKKDRKYVSDILLADYIKESSVGLDLTRQYKQFYNAHMVNLVNAAIEISKLKPLLKTYKGNLTSAYNKRVFWLYNHIKDDFEAGGVEDFFIRFNDCYMKLWNIKTQNECDALESIKKLDYYRRY